MHMRVLRNFKKTKISYYILAAIIIIILGFVLNIDRIDWILIIVAIGLVLSFEAINTSIEFVVDPLQLTIMNMQNTPKI